MINKYIILHGLRVRLNLPPFFGVKESDFRFHILYQCIICTNSRYAPVGKHSDETAPTPLERGFAETAPRHAIHLGVTSQFFFANITSTFNLTDKLIVLL